MKWIYLMLLLVAPAALLAQDPDQLERRQEGQERPVDAEILTQETEYLRRHPVPVNRADAAALRQLPGISELQVQALLQWRQRMGNLLAPEELGAIPGWDPATVLRLAPLLTVLDANPLPALRSWRAGEHTVMIRHGRVLQQTEPYRKGQYAGSPDRLYLRYRYRLANTLRAGLSLEKDPGERWRAGARPLDFVSFHIYWQGKGLLRTLAIGDFTVNLGQGLIQWQAPAYGGGTDLASVKRQGACIQPSLAADEYRFCRGIAATAEWRAWALSVYASRRTLGARIAPGADSVAGVASINEAGYYRTRSELDGRAALAQWAAGARLQRERNGWRLGAQARWLRFSKPLLPGDKPYNRFRAAGAQLLHASLDWAFSIRQAHLFGELASDGAGALAWVQGLLFSGGAGWDATILYRSYPPEYAAFGGNAFGRQDEPQNESGFYSGVQIRPSARWTFWAWANSYRFPWLRYAINTPSAGWQAGLQAVWRPSKRAEASARYRAADDPDGMESTPVKGTALSGRRSLRLQLTDEFRPGSRLSFRSEALWLSGTEKGKSGYFCSVEWKMPAIKRLALALRVHFFDTDGYAARLYQFESEPGGGGMVVPLWGRGARYGLLLQYNSGRFWDLSLRVAHTSRQEDRTGAIPADPGQTEVRTQVFFSPLTGGIAPICAVFLPF